VHGYAFNEWTAMASDEKDPAERIEKSRIPDLKLSDSVAAIMRNLARDYTRALERRLAAHNLTSGMWFPLRILWEKDGILQNEIQKELGTAQPTLTVALDRLERRSLITRRRSTTDRRQVHVELTKRGKELEREIAHYADEIQALARLKVNKRELRTMYAVFGKMKQALEQDLEQVA
jgi:DNA-binding MarR family transcriptional regulator